ncbi:MAG: LLM class flavin-dependent oxidoreductase [Chloroflexota bacterium]|nr:LLM class flavin-dependent oxidoreductase [Dehalococcoidia bacterium]MDW8254851.1 LLM class flavin-dependent oxidoreductase [Chloroflexota bacterium]
MLHSRVGLMMAGRPLRDLVETARRADRAGLHSLWCGDGGDAFSPLTAYALATTKIRLGTAVAVWHRPPVITANAALQLAAVCDGRFTLGLGAGPKQWNEDWWGIPFDRPVGRMREYIAVIRGVFESGPERPFTFEGQHFRVRRYHRSSRHPAPPIVLGTVGLQMNRLAGEVADGVIFDVLLSQRYLRDCALPAVMEGARRAGRERSALSLGAMVCCVADPDERTALQGVKWGLLGHLVAEYFYPVWRDDGFEAETRRAQARLRAGDPAGAVAELSDEFARTVAIVGRPDDCRRQLAAWLELVDFVALWAPHRPEAPHAATLDFLIDLVAA